MNRTRPTSRTDAKLLFQLAPSTLYLLVFFAIPGFVLLLYSFWQKKGFSIERVFTLKNYLTVLTTDLYIRVTLNSLIIGLSAALLAVIISYPLAYGLRFKLRRYQSTLLLLIFVSVVGSYLARIYAWKSILGQKGLINQILLYAGLVQEPLSFLLFNRFAVIITLTNLFVPFAFLPIFSAFQNLNFDVVQAARDLGAGPFQVFYRITLPLTLPGVLAGFMYTFIFATSDFVVTSLMGGVSGLMVSKVIADQFGIAFNWPLGSALAFVFILTLASGYLFLVGLSRWLNIRGAGA
ncbi:ABC transporter permease [Acidobacteria bacterium AH-259-G07]|nr:ABC transporter permease [Acidobacteria bacterium AH-259-G07]